MLVASSTLYGYDVGDELVTNGTFGYGGTPSLAGWTSSLGSWVASATKPSGLPTYSAKAFGDGDGGNILQQTINITTAGEYVLSAYTLSEASVPNGSIQISQGSDLNTLNVSFIDGGWSQKEALVFNLSSLGEYTLKLVTPPLTGWNFPFFADVSLQLGGAHSQSGSSSLLEKKANAQNTARIRNDVVFGALLIASTISLLTQQTATKRDFRPEGISNNRLGMLSEDFSEESLVADRNKIPKKNIPQISKDINVWGIALGQYMHQKKASNSNGFTSGSGGTIVGVDWTISNQSIGFAASYAYTYFNILKDQGHTNINQGTVAPYGVFRFSNWISTISILGGYAHDDNHRNFKNTTSHYHTHGSSYGWQLSPHLDVAYNGIFKNSWFNVVPYAMGDYVANWQSKSIEVGSSDGKTSQKGKFYGFVRAESGVRFYETINIRYGKLILKEKGAYAYQRSTSSKSNSVSIIGTAEAFVVPISTHIQNLFVGEFCMEFVSGKKYVPDIEVSYEGQFGSKFIAQIGTVNLSKKF